MLRSCRELAIGQGWRNQYKHLLSSVRKRACTNNDRCNSHYCKRSWWSELSPGTPDSTTTVSERIPAAINFPLSIISPVKSFTRFCNRRAHGILASSVLSAIFNGPSWVAGGTRYFSFSRCFIVPKQEKNQALLQLHHQRRAGRTLPHQGSPNPMRTRRRHGRLILRVKFSNLFGRVGIHITAENAVPSAGSAVAIVQVAVRGHRVRGRLRRIGVGYQRTLHIVGKISALTGILQASSHLTRSTTPQPRRKLNRPSKRLRTVPTSRV